MELVIGGATFVLGSKTGGAIKMIKAWKSINPERIVDDILDEQNLSDITDTEILAKLLIKKWSIDSTCIHFLRCMHNSIVKYYLKVVYEWETKNSKLKRLDKDDYPPNYTSEMVEFKNIIFSEDTSSIKGFCPYEPLIRLEQLLSFPIEKYSQNLVEIPEIQLPIAPEIPQKKLNLDNKDELLTEIENLLPWIHKKEQYYDDVCIALKPVMSCLE